VGIFSKQTQALDFSPTDAIEDKQTINNMYIPIFRHTEDTRSMLELDIKYRMSDSDVFEIYFINIDNVGEYFDKDDSKFYGTVCSGPNEYISPLTQKEIIALIEKARKSLP